MAIKFQYNKTSLQEMNKQLRIRVNALPILKNKEAALRIEVKRARREAEEMERQLETKLAQQAEMARLWEEFDPGLVQIRQANIHERKIAGVAVPELAGIEFQQPAFSLYNQPAWFPAGIERVKELAALAIQKKLFFRKTELLDHARRKATQKVNLYEKVQIPGYEDAIRKIKRFLEDEENLAKSAQKIVKKRQQEKKLSL
ncbi:MAG: V-type ATP synthase subunit D [Phaeodactylibacter sp.]|nr:V-type ATP synthase subunit D [Phaeodactylibacter sp.]MCB9292532.1 V-type ATP synthase subunit D [Lewinellaceae bacterium]